MDLLRESMGVKICRTIKIPMPITPGSVLQTSTQNSGYFPDPGIYVFEGSVTGGMLSAESRYMGGSAK